MTQWLLELFEASALPVQATSMTFLAQISPFLRPFPDIMNNLVSCSVKGRAELRSDLRDVCHRLQENEASEICSMEPASDPCMLRLMFRPRLCWAFNCVLWPCFVSVSG